MEKIKIELIKITASEGMVLTNGDTYSKEIYLGINDSTENWNEITDAEYEERKRFIKGVMNYGTYDN